MQLLRKQLSERRTPTVRPFHALYYDMPGSLQRSLTEAWSRIAWHEAQTMWQVRGALLPLCRCAQPIPPCQGWSSGCSVVLGLQRGARLR